MKKSPSEIAPLAMPKLTSEAISQQKRSAEKKTNRLNVKLRLGREDLQRRYDRVLRWALRQEHARLAAHFAIGFIKLDTKSILKDLVDNDIRNLRVENADLKWAKDHYLEEVVKNRSDAIHRGLSKARKSPKTAELRAAKKLWQEREEGKHPELRTEEQFAVEVLRRSSALKSIGYIKTKSTQWRREAKSKKKN